MPRVLATRVRSLGLLPLILAAFVVSPSPASDEDFDKARMEWTEPRTGKTVRLQGIPGEYLIRFEEDVTPIEAEGWLRAEATATLRRFGERTRTAILRTEEPRVFLEARPEIAGVSPVRIDEEGFRKYFFEDRLVLRFQDTVTPQQAEARITAAGSEVLRRYHTPGFYLISLPEETDLDSELQRWLDDTTFIRFAEPSYLGFDDALTTPNDPLFLSQWGLRNPGNGSWKETADVWADAAWWIHRGDPDVIIAFVDTGMDMSHEDLVPNLLPRDGEDWDFLDPDPSPDDTRNHGTLVTGIAGAVQNNELGVSGLAPDCRIMPLRVSLDEGEIAERVDAINYAASRKPEFDGMIINCSWGNSSGDFSSVETAIEDAVAAGCVVLCAAGNTGDPVIYPARYPDAIAIGATSPCDERKRVGSCDGEVWASNFGPEIDVVAPGVRIQTTDRTGNLGFSSTNYFNLFNGTSAATPFVAGVCALIASADPTLTPSEIRQILQDSADDEVGWAPEDVPGFDEFMGWGRVNAYKALVLTLHPDGFADDIEVPDPYWTADSTWHVTSVDNHTGGGTQCWTVGDPSDDTYDAGLDVSLYLPDFWVPENGWLSYWQTIEAGELSPGQAVDGGLLEASADGGETWTTLIPEGGYTHIIAAIDGDPFPQGTAVFSGTQPWTEVRVDLTSFTGAPLRVRARFGARAGTLEEERGFGWRIDDVEVAPYVPVGWEPGAGPVGVTDLRTSIHFLAPANPFQDHSRIRFELATPAEVRLDWMDASGRIAHGHDLGWRESGSHELHIDRPAHLPAGSYWLRLATPESSAARRIVVLDATP